MTPLDLLLWSGTFLVASIPIGFGILIIGYCCKLVRDEWRKG